MVDVAGGTDLLRADFNLVVIVGSGAGKFGQMVDETCQHGFQCFLCFMQAQLELTLLVNNLLDAAFGVVYRAQAERVGDDVLKYCNLAVQPFVFNDQLADVFDHQLQQMKQSLPQFRTVIGQQFQPKDEAFEFNQ